MKLDFLSNASNVNGLIYYVSSDDLASWLPFEVNCLYYEKSITKGACFDLISYFGMFSVFQYRFCLWSCCNSLFGWGGVGVSQPKQQYCSFLRGHVSTSVPTYNRTFELFNMTNACRQCHYPLHPWPPHYHEQCTAFLILRCFVISCLLFPVLRQ